MRRLSLYFVALTTVLTFSFSSQAGILFEPFYSHVLSGEIGVVSKDDVSGSLVGARLGLTTLGFMYGVEYNTGTLTREPATGAETDYDLTNVGAFVGFSFPILFRFWLTYNLDQKATYGTNNELSGTGFKVGLAYTGLPFINIAAEHLIYNYDELNGNPIADQEASATMLTLSVPLP